MATKKDPYAPQKRYVDAQRKDGFVRVTLWVPAEARERALAYGKKLRREVT